MKKSNRKLRKVLLVTCCALALVAISVGATLAYLTDTEAVTNVFTVGRVGISLDEARTNEQGKPLGKDGKPTDRDKAARVNGNEYHLIPGQTYTKDPTVTLDPKSESSYIRMLVTVKDYADLLAVCNKHSTETDSYGNPYVIGNTVLLQNFTDWTEASAWDFYGVTVSGTTATYEFRHNEPVSNTSETAYMPLDPLFTEITLPGWVDNADLLSIEDLEINVAAHAMQAAGFENDENAAWSAFNNQMN